MFGDVGAEAANFSLNGTKSGGRLFNAKVLELVPSFGGGFAQCGGRQFIFLPSSYSLLNVVSKVPSSFKLRYFWYNLTAFKVTCTFSTLNSLSQRQKMYHFGIINRAMTLALNVLFE